MSTNSYQSHSNSASQIQLSPEPLSVQNSIHKTATEHEDIVDTAVAKLLSGPWCPKFELWRNSVNYLAYISILTLSSPVVPNGYTTKCSKPYWSNPPFLFFFDVWALWRSGLSARVPERQKNKGLKGLKCFAWCHWWVTRGEWTLVHCTTCTI